MTKKKRKKPGPKPKPESEKFDKKALSFPPGLFGRVQAAARASGKSTSEFVSDVLSRALVRRRKK